MLELLNDWGINHLDEIAPQEVPHKSKVSLTCWSSQRPLYTKYASSQIFLNGNWVGAVDVVDTGDLVSHIRNHRRSDQLEPEVSVSRDVYSQEVHIFTDAGRCCRPLYVVETDPAAATQKLLIKSGHVARVKKMRTLLQLVSELRMWWHAEPCAARAESRRLRWTSRKASLRKTWTLKNGGHCASAVPPLRGS